jgi:hypothetical protein
MPCGIRKIGPKTLAATIKAKQKQHSDKAYYAINRELSKTQSKARLEKDGGIEKRRASELRKKQIAWLVVKDEFEGKYGRECSNCGHTGPYCTCRVNDGNHENYFTHHHFHLNQVTSNGHTLHA